MAETAKSSIISRVTEEGYTSSYGTLLYLTASMGPEPRQLEPDTPMELAVWHGHFQGLRAALLCLAMHERQLAPKAAAQVVGRHIKDARVELGPGDDTEDEE